MDNRLSTLEEDLEEEQLNSESAIDKARKAEQQVDSLSTEFSQAQSNLQKAESTRSQQEKQVRRRGVRRRRRRRRRGGGGGGGREEANMGGYGWWGGVRRGKR